MFIRYDKGITARLDMFFLSSCTVKNGVNSIHSWGVPQTSLKLPPGCTVKVYMYLLGCKESSRVLPLKNANKGMWYVLLDVTKNCLLLNLIMLFSITCTLFL